MARPREWARRPCPLSHPSRFSQFGPRTCRAQPGNSLCFLPEMFLAENRYGVRASLLRPGAVVWEGALHLPLPPAAASWCPGGVRPSPGKLTAVWSSPRRRPLCTGTALHPCYPPDTSCLSSSSQLPSSALGTAVGMVSSLPGCWHYVGSCSDLLPCVLCPVEPSRAGACHLASVSCASVLTS